MTTPIRTAKWATRLPPERCRPYGMHEVHAVIFVPKEDTDSERSTVAVIIPEANNAVRPAMGLADRDRLRVLLICDTAKQAKRCAAQVSALLPRHRRLPIEKAQHGVFGLGH